MRKFIDITGQRFGMLTVIGRTEDYASPNGRTYTRWMCKCDCGKETAITKSDLTSGHTKSCGCKRIRETSKHMKMLSDTNVRGCFDGTAFSHLKKEAKRNSTTGVRGVFLIPSKKFIANITFKRKKYYLGIYNTLEEAAKARKEGEERIWGDFIEWYNQRRDI